MIGYRFVCVQQKTARTRILEFMCYTGAWIGEPDFLPVKAIADGADVTVRHARKVLAALASKGEIRSSKTRPAMYAALGGTSDE